MKAKNAKRFIEEEREEELVKRLKRERIPVYGVGVNQGFGVLGNFIYILITLTNKYRGIDI